MAEMLCLEEKNLKERKLLIALKTFSASLICIDAGGS